MQLIYKVFLDLEMQTHKTPALYPTKLSRFFNSFTYVAYNNINIGKQMLFWNKKSAISQKCSQTVKL